MPEARDFSIFIRPQGGGVVAMDLAVEGVSCGGCIRRIEHALKLVPGVAEARLSISQTADWPCPGILRLPAPVR